MTVTDRTPALADLEPDRWTEQDMQAWLYQLAGAEVKDTSSSDEGEIMMKTWAVTWHEDGAAYTEGYLTEDDARAMAADLVSGYPDASAWDMLPPLAARFPVGSRVRNTGSSTLGTVAEQGPDGLMNEIPAAHAIMWRAEEAVSVLWDGSRFPSWTVAAYVEAASSLAAASEPVQP